VHSDTLYVKNKRNKSRKKKPVATVKNPRVLEYSTSYMPRAMPWVNYFLHFKNSHDLKVLGFFVKLYPRVSGLVATPDPRVMFIILIITLNLG
jgi:hypothetical protein